MLVNSEVGRLKKVLVHRPGNELLKVLPTRLNNLLFDDVPYLEQMQQEHDIFVDVMRKQNVEVLYLVDEMTSLFTNESIKKQFIFEWLHKGKILPLKINTLIYDYLLSLPNRECVLKLIEGISDHDLNIPLPGLRAVCNYDDGILIDPLPNTYFTRDPMTVIFDGVAHYKMFYPIRQREVMFSSWLFKEHPNYQNMKNWYVPEIGFEIEGGDLLVINKNLLLIGCSQRTSLDAIEELSKNLHKKYKDLIVLAIMLPKARAYMHLDTVLTAISEYKFVYYQDIFKHVSYIKIDNQKAKLMTGNLKQVLEQLLEHQVTLFPCGNNMKLYSEREQWNDGSNVLALDKDLIIAYDRNRVTNQLLKDSGINVIEIPSFELSRGRGGPHCMSMPLDREEN